MLGARKDQRPHGRPKRRRRRDHDSQHRRRPSCLHTSRAARCAPPAEADSARRAGGQLRHLKGRRTHAQQRMAPGRHGRNPPTRRLRAARGRRMAATRRSSAGITKPWTAISRKGDCTTSCGSGSTPATSSFASTPSPGLLRLVRSCCERGSASSAGPTSCAFTGRYAGAQDASLRPSWSALPRRLCARRCSSGGWVLRRSFVGEEHVEEAFGAAGASPTIERETVDFDFPSVEDASLCPHSVPFELMSW
jgi:hypothetical protein